MAISLNLQKAEQSLRLNLEKKGIITPPTVELGFLLDVSGSFRDEHEEGVTNDLLSRLIPWGLTFDPDKKLDVITFSHGKDHVHAVGSVSEKNYQNYIQNNVINRVPGWCGGTDYSYAIEESLRSFGWIPNESKGGFFGKLLGKKSTPSEKRLAAVLVLTDGANSDQKRTEQVIQESHDRGDKVYFVFIGVSNQPGEFAFIDRLANKFDNVGILKVADIRSFVRLSDDDLNAKLVTDEFAAWLKA